MIAKPAEAHWVIERTSEFMRTWWTGNDWTDDYTQAKWYREPPDVSVVTGEEEAHAVRYESDEMQAG